MKISTETLLILKNFSSINSSLWINPGNIISTVSPQKNILAEAVVLENFPQQIRIHDLNKLLSVISLFKDGAELDFDDLHVYIKGLGGRSKIKYRFAHPNTIPAPTTKKIELPTIDAQFKLTEEDFNWILRSANVLSCPDIAIESDGNEVNMTAFDLSNDSAHTNSILLPITADTSYKLVFKTDSLKMLPRTYNVTISSKGIAKFLTDDEDLCYYVTLDATSQYGV